MWVAMGNLIQAPPCQTPNASIDLQFTPSLGLVYNSYLSNSDGSWQFMSDSQQALAAIQNLLHSQDYAGAFMLAQQSVQQSTEDAELWHLAGVLAAQHGEYLLAKSYLLHAHRQASNNPNIHNHLGNVFAHLGEHAEASHHYHHALQLQPDFADAYNNIGNLHFRAGDINAAIKVYEHCVYIDPKHAPGHLNLGKALSKQERFEQAEQHFFQASELDPALADAHYNLGVIARQIGKMSLALKGFWRYSAARPHDVDGFYQLAFTYQEMGNLEESIQYYQHVLASDPKHAKAHHNLATMYHKMEKIDLAEKHYATSLACDPKNPIATYLLAAIRQQHQAFAQAPEDYVTSLFDQYALHYDQHLSQHLNYQVPQQLIHFLQQEPGFLLPNRLKILDLGCGTGLCGTLLHPYARQLIGVDLSSNMLSAAQHRGVYANLIQANIKDYLQHSPPLNCDLIIAAEVLLYFGDLVPLLRLCHQHLNSTGIMIFSLERLDTATEASDYYLDHTGRFCHSTDYISTSCQAIGFTVKRCASIVLRTHQGKPVEGLAVQLSRT